MVAAPTGHLLRLRNSLETAEAKQTSMLPRETFRRQMDVSKYSGCVPLRTFWSTTLEYFQVCRATWAQCDSVVLAKPFLEIPDEDWLNIFNVCDSYLTNILMISLNTQVNVMSGIRCTRHYLPQMLKNNWGRVIFIASESAFNVPPEMIHYG